MDEVIKTKSFGSKLFEKARSLFVIDPVSFSNKKRINFRGIAILGGVSLAIFCVAIFVMPVPEVETRSYSERKSTAQVDAISHDPSPSQDQNPLSNSVIRSGLQNSRSLGGGSMGGSATNRNTTMIIARDSDSSTTLPPGTKFMVKLSQTVTVTARSIPVIGKVVSSVESRSSVAIPEDSQIFGEATLDQDSERASITWKSILFPDGRSKNLSAVALGADNQAGVEGDYHSDAFKNTAGQMITHFVGGFAEGAISHGPLGANQGGVENGLLQGVADTAKDRTEAWGEDLKKQKTWINLEAGTQFQVILSQPFIFRDPGVVN